MIYTNTPVAIMLLVFAMGDFISRGRITVPALARTLMMVGAIMLQLPVLLPNATGAFDSPIYIAATALVGIVGMLLLIPRIPRWHG
jgi:hypothetical protein